VSHSAFQCVRGMKLQGSIFHPRVGPCNFHKKGTRTRHIEFVFLRPVRSTGHVVYSIASGTRNVNALFFMFGSVHCSFHKKRVRTHYAKLMFLRLVGSAGHIVHSGAFEARYIDTLFSIKSVVEQIRPYFCFCIWWDPHVT
jgi:hypothetical protein